MRNSAKKEEMGKQRCWSSDRSEINFCGDNGATKEKINKTLMCWKEGIEKGRQSNRSIKRMNALVS